MNISATFGFFLFSDNQEDQNVKCLKTTTDAFQVMTIATFGPGELRIDVILHHTMVLPFCIFVGDIQSFLHGRLQPIQDHRITSACFDFNYV